MDMDLFPTLELTDEHIGALEQAFADAGLLDQVVGHVTNYNGNWKGEAFFTFHSYGAQIHRIRSEAEKWNKDRQEMFK